MNTKTYIWIGVIIGSTIGGAIPLLWGGDMFSFSSIILSTTGGLAGIYAGYRLGNW